MTLITTKRVYDPIAKDDGYRILVDRLWPRGLKKEDAGIDEWMKEIAPSSALRKWFNHEPGKWKDFVAAYEDELHHSDEMKQLKSRIKEHERVTLLYAAKDEQHNNALVVRAYLKHRHK